MLQYLIIYLAIAGVLNPIILFHTDFVGRKVTPAQYVKYGLLLNVFGFILIPTFSFIHHFKTIRDYRKVVKQPVPGPVLKVVQKDESGAETRQPVDPNSFTSSGNKTIH